MAKKSETPPSEHRELLKQRIGQTFALRDLKDLRGLPERLSTLGYGAIASDLAQLLETESKPPETD